MSDKLKQALFYEQLQDSWVRCNLCANRCQIAKDKVGRCSVRKNISGKLYSLNYDKVCAAGSDAIEKKPLFHFLPASRAFSLASVGCNFKCNFCQNWQISQPDNLTGRAVSPEQLVALAIENNCSSIAYTYTEPTVFFELCNDTARVAKQNGLYNVFVSNGYMTKDVIDVAAEWLDAINIDLKAFSQDFYQNQCSANLQPVLDTIKYISNNTDIWLELTTLIIPDLNDSADELKRAAEFILTACGDETPWHLSRFYPQYKSNSIAPTPEQTLLNAYNIAKQTGLKYVYIGNLPAAEVENTYCSSCGKLLIERAGFDVLTNIIKDGLCPDCYQSVSGFFD